MSLAVLFIILLVVHFSLSITNIYSFFSVDDFYEDMQKFDTYILIDLVTKS